MSAWVDEDPVELGPFGAGLPSTDEILELVRDMMRHDADGWRIVAMERRYHCAGEEATADFCQ